MRTVPAANIVLDDLVITSPHGQRQTQPEAREQLASGRAASGPPAASREQLASGAVGGKIAAFWKKAAQASALYLAARGGNHSCPTDRNKPVFSIFDAICHGTCNNYSICNVCDFGTFGNAGNGVSCG